MLTTDSGYPSIDKPWLRYYSEEAMNVEPFIGSIYEHIRGKGQGENG